ncbi:hypothetical protein H0H81_006188 [Sphagnurus paluster]|uniref:Uncharacterized protein n=1 Tax=Sphagnurus paluster TaxID=117069 RepID=A0A9P7FXN9_9AGAR|nr:hypothetical protein H0H81_006188 [Sphagnurus paluster]
MSYKHPSKDVDEGPIIIDTFAPRPLMCDLSPTSSASSDLESPESSPCSSFDAFVSTRSRVVRVCGVLVAYFVTALMPFDTQLYNLPRLAEAYLSAVFLPQSNLRGPIPAPVSLWTLREEYAGPRPDTVWAVFRTHEEAAAALSLSNPALSVTTALESDLEPFHKLRRFILAPPVSAALLT